MARPLAGGIAKQLARAARRARITFDATLVKIAAATRTAGALSAGTNPTETSYTAKGFVTTRTTDKVDGMLVEKGDRVVTLLGSTIASAQVPTTKDKVSINSEMLRILAVESDPARAYYTLLTRLSPEDSWSPGFSSGFGG